MILHFDLDLNRLISGPTGRSGALSKLVFMERATEPLELRLWRGRVPAALDQASEIIFGIKSHLGAADFLAVAPDTDWTPSEGGTIWSSELVLNTAELAEAVGSLETIRTLAQLSLDSPGTTRLLSQPVHCAIYGAIVRGDEGTPTALPTPEEWLAARSLPLPLQRLDPPLSTQPATAVLTLSSDVSLASTLIIGDVALNLEALGTMAPYPPHYLIIDDGGDGIWTPAEAAIAIAGALNAAPELTPFLPLSDPTAAPFEGLPPKANS